jgi:hypothetical protein
VGNVEGWQGENSGGGYAYKVRNGL